MSRLIDADKALEIVHNQGIAHPSAYHLTNYATLILQEAPTIDAVPVVRCKDCRNGKRGSDNTVKCNHPSGKIIMMTAYGFCSYGE